MIFGSYSPFSISEKSDKLRQIFLKRYTQNIEYYPVKNKYFTGGYLINSRLPYKSSDIEYYDQDGDLLVLFSGVLYNRNELLSGNSYSRTKCEPEIIAELFISEGPDFAVKLNGDFAVFICSFSRGEAFLFRDQLGIRPLAWIFESNTLWFSTDILALCQVFQENQSIDSEALLGFFKNIDFKRTINEKVKKLMPGHYLKFNGKSVKTIQYWKPEKICQDTNLRFESMHHELESLVIDSIRIRSDKQFVAGAHVTGGLDSGIVAALARREYSAQKEFFGFSWADGNFMPESCEFDERALVLKLSENAGIRTVFSAPTRDEYLKVIQNYYINQGYFNEDKTSELAGSMNLNLIFSGWGGDEFISTASRGVDIDLLRRLKLGLFFRRNPVLPVKRFLKRVLYYSVFPTLGILNKDLRTALKNDARYLIPEFNQGDKSAIRNFYFHSSRKQLHLRNLKFYNLQERCESWFVIGFRNGIEYRYPLLDKRIVEYILKVPSELLCRSDLFRPILRELGKGILPEDVRMNKDKSDKICWSYMDSLNKDIANDLIKETDSWKNNQKLSMFDFNLLEKDIDIYQKNPDEFDDKFLFRSLVQIKALHHFTMEYFSENSAG